MSPPGPTLGPMKGLAIAAYVEFRRAGRSPAPAPNAKTAIKLLSPAQRPQPVAGVLLDTTTHCG